MHDIVQTLTAHIYIYCKRSIKHLCPPSPKYENRLDYESSTHKGLSTYEYLSFWDRVILSYLLHKVLDTDIMHKPPSILTD